MKSLVLTTLLTGTIVFSTIGCSHKDVKPDQAITNAKIAAPAVVEKSQPLDLEMAHFAFNSAVLTKAGKSALQRNAEALKKDSNLKIQVQGFCDDRGSVQYNLALGERRALAARKYLNTLGISKDRIATVSFGKANPLDAQNNEQAWARNRRASFVIQSEKTSSHDRAG